MPRPLKLLLFSCLTLIGIAGVLETAARLVLSQDAISRRLLKRFDESSWRIDWANRHRDGVEVLYGFDRYDSTKGWSTYPNIRNLEVFGDKVLNTNRFGHRGSLDLLPSKRPGWRRIVVLGDSYTFGDEVSDHDTYSHLLGERLADERIEVINLGVHGYGHDQMLILLREQGRKLDPDLVLVGFIYDDVPRNALGFRDFAKPYFELKGDALVLRNSPVPTPFVQASRERWRSRTLDVALMIWRRIDNRLGWRVEREELLAAQLLDEIAKLSESLGARTFAAFLPEAVELSEPENARAHERFLLDHCAQNESLECGSALPAFEQRAAAGEHFEVGRHWAAKGHRLVADTLLTLLRERGLLDPAD